MEGVGPAHGPGAGSVLSCTVAGMPCSGPTGNIARLVMSCPPVSMLFAHSDCSLCCYYQGRASLLALWPTRPMQH
jgi:hypothetical protein